MKTTTTAETDVSVTVKGNLPSSVKATIAQAVTESILRKNNEEDKEGANESNRSKSVDILDKKLNLLQCLICSTWILLATVQLLTILLCLWSSHR